MRYFDALELKIALFCLVITVLAYFYQMVDPGLGALICSVALVTLFLSLAVFAYHLIFKHSGGPLMVVFFAGIYAGALGKVFDVPFVMKGGILVGLLALALIAFFRIFFPHRQDEASDEAQADMNADLVKCPKCGAMNPRENVFCESCGYKLK